MKSKPATLPQWWESAWIIERQRQQQGWNALFHARPGHRFRRWASLFFRICWPLGTAVLGGMVLRVIRVAMDPGDAAVQYLLAMVALFTGLILLVSAIKFAYQTFYAAPDLPLLQSLPIAPRGIFVAKYLDNLAFSNYLVTIFAVGPFLAYGLAWEWPFSKFVITVLGLWFLPVYTTALGITVSVIVSRLVPRARMRETLMLGSMAASVLFYAAMRQAIHHEMAAGMVQPEVFLWPWLPTSWLAIWVMDLEPLQGGLPLATYFFLGLVLFVLSAWVGDAVYHWGVVHLERDGARTPGAKTPWLLRWHRGAPGPGRAIWFKDLLTFSRDPRQWYYLVFFAILFFLPADPARANTGAKGLERMLVLVVSNAFILVIMATMALQELTVLGISREGQKRWMLQATPITPMQILLGKFNVILLFTVALAAMGAVALALIGQLAPADIIPTLIGSVLIAGCLNWAFLSLGARWPDFEGYQQRQRVSPVLALAIALVDGVVLAVFLFSAILLASYEAWAPGIPMLAAIPFNTLFTVSVGLMTLTLLALIAGGAWNGYTAVRGLLQER